MAGRQIDPAAVREVMRACNCAEDRAANVLRRCGGNVEQAKTHLQKLQQALKPPSQSQASSRSSFGGSASLPPVGAGSASHGGGSMEGTFTPPSGASSGFSSPQPFRPAADFQSPGVAFPGAGFLPTPGSPPVPGPADAMRAQPYSHNQSGMGMGTPSFTPGINAPGVSTPGVNIPAMFSSPAVASSSDPMDWTRAVPGVGAHPDPSATGGYAVPPAPVPASITGRDVASFSPASSSVGGWTAATSPPGQPQSYGAPSAASPFSLQRSPERPLGEYPKPPREGKFHCHFARKAAARGISSKPAPPCRRSYYRIVKFLRTCQRLQPSRRRRRNAPPAASSTSALPSNPSLLLHPKSPPVSGTGPPPPVLPSMSATPEASWPSAAPNGNTPKQPGYSTMQQAPGPLQDTRAVARKPVPSEQPHSNMTGRSNEIPIHGHSPTPAVNWDFVLPSIPPPSEPLIPTMGEERSTGPLDMTRVVAAILHGAAEQSVRAFLEAHGDRDVRAKLAEGEVEGIPSIFYVVATNNSALLRMWVAYGAHPSAVHRETGVPLLAFAVVNSENIGSDTTAIVSTLLSLGASPTQIPREFYTPYTRDLPPTGPERKKGAVESAALDGSKPNDNDSGVDKAWPSWCTEQAAAKLARNMGLTHRYNLDRAWTAKKISGRHRQVARIRKADAILGVPFYLVGQSLAAQRLLTKMLSYLTIPSRRPLVLAFTGPSGHGKTELARCLGKLMDLELEVVDCTIFNREMELFGPRHPYAGADRGAPLNNFLVRHAGQRCIVFLDEFEKTTSDIHQALLLPFDKGEYQDRRTLNNIDCSKTIWILATNALDDTIQSFCEKNEQILIDNDEIKQKLGKDLTMELREAFLAQFDAPLTGRISEFVPFLPFSKGEQAVVVHKFLLELVEKVKLPIRLAPGREEQLLGNVRLHIARDGTVCKRLAEVEYSKDLGARSLGTAVRVVEDLLVESYLDDDEEISETSAVRHFVVDVKDNAIAVRRIEVA